jgi:hypothetical protein
MRIHLKACLVGLLPILFATPGHSEEDAGWELRNGCVPNRHIKRVKFDSTDSGIVELTGGKKLRLTLRTGCSGIRTEGYVHKPVNHQFCEGDILRVLNYGNVCVVDRLEPLLELDDGMPSETRLQAEVPRK